MESYLQEIKDLVEQLALASSPGCDEDLILLVLNGLPEEYNAFKTTIRAKSEVLSMEELCSLLCSEAIHVENSHKHSTSDLTVAFSATNPHLLTDNTSATSSVLGAVPSPHNQQYYGQSSSRNFSFQNRGGSRSQGQYRGGGRYISQRGRR